MLEADKMITNVAKAVNIDWLESMLCGGGRNQQDSLR